MKRIILSLIKSVVSIALCLCVVLSGLSFVASAFLDEAIYTDQIVTDEYVDEIENILIERLEADSLFYDIPIDYILAGLDRAELESISAEYVRALIQSFKSGAQIPKAEYDAAYFENEIKRYLADNPDIGSFYEEETVIEIAGELKLTVDHALNSFIDIGVIESIVRSAYSNKYIAFAANNFYSFVGVGVLLAAILFILNGKKILWGIYSALGSVWCGAVLLFVPAYIIKSNNFLANTILEKGPFKLLLNGIYELLIGRLMSFSTILFIVSSVALLVSIILLAIFFKIKDSDGENEKS